MQIMLDQDEIGHAIQDYVRGQITVADTSEITIDFKSTRGDAGLIATLDIRPINHKIAVRKTHSTVSQDQDRDESPVEEEQEQVKETAKPKPRKAAKPKAVKPTTGLKQDPPSDQVPEEEQDEKTTETVTEEAPPVADVPTEAVVQNGADNSGPKSGSIFNFGT